MSIKSWKKEFYTSRAGTVAKRGPKAALLHSIKKWNGLTRKELKKHGISTNSTADLIASSEYFDIDGGTCALCHYNDNKDGHDCERCPIVKAGRLSCTEGGEWMRWYNEHDSTPMRKLLKKTYKKLYGDL